jgi:type IV pilus assembly protein PilE
MRMQRGFSLVELMIVVGIVGILSAIGIPAYNDYVIRGKIADATSNLSTKRLLMEQFYLDNRTYVDGPGCTADTTTSQHFDFSCLVANGGVVPTTSAYTIAATGKAGMVGFTYTINQANAKATPDTRAGWTSSGTCWVTKKGGTC